MNRLILLFLFALSALTANADELKNARKVIGEDLNSTVKVIKNDLKAVNDELENSSREVRTMKVQAKELLAFSDERESNPTVLAHGADKVEDCKDKKELAWNGTSWVCTEPSYGTDCVQANDEYKYENPVGSGKYFCTKHPKGQSIKYKWEFRANSNECFSNTYKRKVYRCYYVNKNGQQVDVEESYCGKSSDLTGSNGPRCTSTWQTGSWSGCSKSCGGGTQTRSVTCKANHFCPGAKPATSRSCNTHACRSSGSSCTSRCSSAPSRSAYESCIRSCSGSSNSGNCGAQGCGNNGGGRNQSGGTTGNMGNGR
jgi:hypothetical protein